MTKYANEMTLKNLLNCYYRECNNYKLLKIYNDSYLFSIELNSISSIFEVSVNISPILRSPSWQLPCHIVNKEGKIELEPLEAVSLISKELAILNNANYDDIQARISDSTTNIAKILQNRKHKLDEVFGYRNSFITNEQNLIRGHRLQPDPKSRQGFSDEEFIKYSPETTGQLQLHYMYIDKDILETQSL